MLGQAFAYWQGLWVVNLLQHSTYLLLILCLVAYIGHNTPQEDMFFSCAGRQQLGRGSHLVYY